MKPFPLHIKPVGKLLLAGSLTLLLLWPVAPGQAAMNIVTHYSPKNSKRPARSSTRFIILHTTEGGGKGSLEKLRRYGEAHYMVDREGKITRIIQRTRVALHAGRSMWNKLTNIDNHSIGIEVAGYHNRPITDAQYRALKDLLKELKGIYKVPDRHIIPHSMVAYGAPNRWHKRSHRGRKRCAMLFAQSSVRTRLGLSEAPTFDPDVKANRLVVADPFLAKVLYGNRVEQQQAATHFTAGDVHVIAAGRSAWDIARDKYNSPEALYTFPDGTHKRGNEITNWKSLPPGTRVSVGEGQAENAQDSIQVIGKDGDTAMDLAGEEYNSASTIYFYPDGKIRTGKDISAADFRSLPKATRLLVGYVNGGPITARRSAFDICGARWNQPSTYYRLKDGRMVTGNTINERAIPSHAMVFYPE